MGGFWFRLFRPSYWVMLYNYSQQWDEFLMRAAEAGEIERLSEHTAKIGGKVVWISNFPHGFGHGYGSHANNLRPHAKNVLTIAEAVALHD